MGLRTDPIAGFDISDDEYIILIYFILIFSVMTQRSMMNSKL